MAGDYEPEVTEWVMIGRILLAAALSAFIGFERETKKQGAPMLRMHILVGAGAATFVGVALLNTHNWKLGDVNRVPAGVASGVGFLGAGLIFKTNERVTGLTTAAGIWIVAAIGYGAANGYHMLAITVTLLVLTVQFGLFFFLSPKFWNDVKDKVRLTYESQESMERKMEEGQQMLSSGGGSGLSNANYRAIDQTESG